MANNKKYGRYMANKKLMITVFLITQSIFSTPEIGDIIEDPLHFSGWDHCFILKKNKSDSEHFVKVENGEQIKSIMIQENLTKIYFRDCRLEKKWRKILRKQKI